MFKRWVAAIFPFMNRQHKAGSSGQSNGSGQQNKDQQPQQKQKAQPNPQGKPITPELSQTVDYLNRALGGSPDFMLKKVGETPEAPVRLAIAFIDGLVDAKQVIKLTQHWIEAGLKQETVSEEAAQRIIEHLPVDGIKAVYTKQELVNSILAGKTALMMDGFPGAFTASLPGGVRRSVEEPTSQTVIRGPKEGFTEDISTNISLLRRKIRSPDLCFTEKTIGRYTQTRVAMAYIEGVADPAAVKEISARLDAIDTDSILESGYIEEFIQDGVYTPFPTVFSTERPDTVAAGMLEGLVGILVDGTPFALVAPVTFFKFFNSSEDYYQRYDISSFLRMVRFFSFLVAMLLPSLYIAVTTFHQEMLPTTLLISIAAQREGTPLPAVLEALVMEFTFEIIREAGVRMPRAIGPAISIVGALVLGQAAVQAGLVSAAMVIVVSFTAISNFVLPAINMASAVRLLRFMFMFLAGTLGLFGILVGAIPLLVHLVSIRSFGVPYMTPLAPIDLSAMKDFLIRVPWWKMKRRPKMYAKGNLVRQSVSKPDTRQDFVKRVKDELE